MAGRRGDLSLAVLRGDEDPAELGEHVGRRRRVLGPVPGRQRVRRGGGKVGCDTSTPSTTQLLPPATAGWPTPAGRGARWRRISCGLSGQTGSRPATSRTEATRPRPPVRPARLGRPSRQPSHRSPTSRAPLKPSSGHRWVGGSGCGGDGPAATRRRRAVPRPETRDPTGRHARPAPAGPPRCTPDRRWSTPPTPPTPAPIRYDSTLARAAGEGPAAAAPRR